MTFQKVLTNLEVGGPDTAESARMKWNANDAELDAIVTDLETNGLPGTSREIIELASDVSTTNSSAFQDVGLNKAVVAGQIYQFQATLISIRTSAGTGVNIFHSVTGPASPTMFIYYKEGITTGGTYMSSDYDSDDQSNVPTQNQAWLVKIWGIIQPSVDGTLKMRFMSGSGATHVIKAGSTLEIY